MITQGTEYYIYLILAVLAVTVITVVIPCYGYLRKGWKGLGIGCLIQPFVAFLLCGLVIGISFMRLQHTIRKNHEAAMVTVRTTAVEDGDTLVRTWYLKPDEECLCEIRPIDGDTTDFDDIEFFDIVPQKEPNATDTLVLCVDDRIFATFDLKAHTATATEFGQPIDIVRINWQNVGNYVHDLSLRK